MEKRGKDKKENLRQHLHELLMREVSFFEDRDIKGEERSVMQYKRRHLKDNQDVYNIIGGKKQQR